MQVFIASDLHLHVRSGEAIRKMAKYVTSVGTKDDVLLLLGDYGNTLEMIGVALNLFSSFPGQKIAVIGNHDLWDKTVPTVERYKQVQFLIQFYGFHSLDESELRLENIGFAGGVGWYDYSFREDSLGIPMEAYKTKTFPGVQKPKWNDSVYCNWGMSDEEVTEVQLQQLRGQLERLRDIPVIVGLHHVPTKELLFHPRFLVSKDWQFTNAFLGSQRFAELIEEFSNVKMVFCGHIHGFKTVRRYQYGYASVNVRQLLILDTSRGSLTEVSFKN